MDGKSDVTVGFEYSIGMHLALCYPVDELQEIRFADRVAWSGNVSSGRISIDQPELYGGESREGGVGGDIDVLDGAAAQARNDYLVTHLGATIPAFRGVLSLVFRHFWIGNNPYLKNPAFTVKRTATHTDGTAQWYLAKADISGDMNPAHILRECLTNGDWGMDYPTTIIDDSAFSDAADTLYTEGFGLSIMWSQQEQIETFVQRILDHIDGVLREDPASGDIGLYLIRDDYTPASLPLLDESNVLALESFERRAWGETVNELTVVYHDRATDKDVPVTVQDIGNIQIQGAIINQTRQYPAITNGDLALQVALRDLRVLAAPLSKIKLQVNREAWALRRGDVFRFSWDRLGIVTVVYRILAIEDGDLVNGAITLTAIEDVFGLPAAVYANPQPSDWVVPNNPPAPVPHQQLVESSYWDVQQTVPPADIAMLDPDFGYVLAHGVRPSGDAFNYRMLSRTGSADYVQRATGAFCPTAELDGALGIAEGGLTDAVVSIKNAVDLARVAVDSFAYLGDEMVAVRAVNIAANTITVDRGILDTVPVAHADGTRIWFADGNQGQDPTERVDAQSVDVKLLPVTGLGALAEGSATAISLTLDNRYQRPYPPGNVKFNGVAYPASIVGFLTLTWSHRDRTLQTAYLNDQTEGDIGPETGTTYNLRIYDESDTLVKNETGLTGTSYAFSDEISTPVWNYIRDTIGTGHFWKINEPDTETIIADEHATAPYNRTLYGATAELGAKNLLKESLGSTYLPGVGDYIGQSDVDLTNNDAISVWCAVEFGSLSGTHCIVQDGGATRGFYFGLYGGEFGVWIQDGTAGAKSLKVTAATYLTVNTIHLVGCIVNGTTGSINIQIDGVTVASSTTLGAFTDFDGTNGLSFGGCYNTLSIDGTSAPVGGLGGYLDYLYIVKGVVSQTHYDQLFAQAEIEDGSGADLNAQLRIELESVRDGLLCRQKHDITVTR